MPLIVNLTNPFYDSHKYSYDSLECINCGEKNCKNCPIPVTKEKTLQQYIDEIVHPSLFNENESLYETSEWLKNKHDKLSEEVVEEKKDGDFEMQKPSQAKVKTSLQDSSDEEDKQNTYNNSNLIYQYKKKKPSPNANRHLVFMLELVLVNRIIDKNSANILSKLLSFDSHPRDKKGAKSVKSSSSSSSGPTLSDCFEFFRQPEKLDKENSWYCNVCKDHVQATKTIEIYKTPAVLILCFQRFKSHNIYFKDKLEDKIEYPVNSLDMTPHVLSHKNSLGEDSKLLYDLVGVSNHYGSLAFGHYTAYAKNCDSGIWYDYNDSSVSTVSTYNNEDDVVTKDAYVLYYIRKDFFPEGKIDFNQIRIGLENDTNTIIYHKQNLPPQASTDGG